MSSGWRKIYRRELSVTACKTDETEGGKVRGSRNGSKGFWRQRIIMIILIIISSANTQFSANTVQTSAKCDT